ncbi:hypothetical protein BKA70DRAFT_742410 [Coprinopsis sp. MPI-PUGE-AT-0042]|nr:hypothetical protein BKA70DRAFT_742410 [Coprinopsis sp. MPI-PUGE-AT-0042]
MGEGALYQGLEDAQVGKYYGVAVCVMYMCDYVETFAEEVEYMWKGKRWNLSRLFFFLSRYIAMAQIPILFSLYTPTLGGSTCKAVHITVLMATYVGEAFPVAIMLLCLFALYDSRTKYAPLFFGTFALLMLALLGTMIVFILNLSVPTSRSQSGVCYTLNTPFGERFMLINRVLKLGAQFVMFLLAAWRAWKRFREYRTPLMKVIYTGGVYYYSGVAVMAAVDIAARYYSTGDPARLKIITYLGRFGTPILANRLILGMYRQIHVGHTQGNLNVATSMSGLKFSPPPIKQKSDLKGTRTSMSSYATSRTRDTWELQSGKKDEEYEVGSQANCGTTEEGRKGPIASDGPRHPSVWFAK